MGLFSSEKNENEKIEKMVQKALESMDIQEANGFVHAGTFELGASAHKKNSRVLNEVLAYLQNQGHEIIDIKFHNAGIGESIRDLSAVVLYK